MLKKIAFPIVALLTALAVGFVLSPAPVYAVGESDVNPSGGSGSLRCSNTLSEFESQAAASVTQADTTLFIGFAQVSGNNQNPIVASWTNGVQDWCRDDIEETGDDGRGYGIWWDGGNTLYAAFSATGTQSGPNYTRWTGDGWMNSYGPGGGGRVTIILGIDAATGEPANGTYITARLTNGNSNSTTAQELDVAENGNVLVRLNSAYSPRNIDKSRMSCSGASGFSHWLEFNPTLTTAIGSTAERCVPSLESAPPPNAPVPQYINRVMPADGASELANAVTLTWAQDTYSDWYHIVLLNGAGQVVHNEWYEGSVVCAADCAAPVLNLANGTYSWWMSSYYTDPGLGVGYSGHYDETTFTVGPPPPGVITTTGPTGRISTPLPVLQWEPDPNAEWYQIYLQGPTGLLNGWFAAEDVTINNTTYPGVCGDLCELPPTLSNWWLVNGDYTWWIQGWRASGFGAWNEGATFALDTDEITSLSIDTPTMPTAGTVAITWPVAPAAAWYQLWVGSADYSRTDHFEWHDVTSVCADSSCSVDVTMPAGEAIIWLRAWGPAGFSSGGEGGWYASEVFIVGN